jgi:F-box and WD-40 domain protein CDC4
VFEGRWCVAASNRNDSTVLDVWDFGNDKDDDWVGEPPGGMYDEDSEDDEEEDMDQVDVDAMDEDLEVIPSEPDTAADEQECAAGNSEHAVDSDVESMDRGEGVEASRWAPSTSRSTTSHHRHRGMLTGETSRRRGNGAPSSEISQARPLPLNDETPTRPRIRIAGNRRR